MICAVIVIFLLNIGSSARTNNCLTLDGRNICSNTSTPYRYYATKTAYHIAIQNQSVQPLQTEGCEPKLFYIFNRHGTRYPDAAEIEEMNKKLPILKERIINGTSSKRVKICNEDIERLKKWIRNMAVEDHNRVGTTGEKEVKEVAERYKAMFPSIFDQTYSPENFIFEYSSKERTFTTAKAFAKGIFGDEANINLDGLINDKILIFHNTCKIIMKRCNVKLNVAELKYFSNSPTVQNMIRSVSERIGFKLSKKDVRLMYRACVFGYALDLGDEWCSVFSEDELKVFEFEDDLDDYYKDAYGNEVNTKQACPMIKYLVDLLSSSLDDDRRKAVIHLSHSGSIKKVFAMLGLYRDDKPLTGNMCRHMDRRWKSSLICPFNAHLAFVLFQCKDQQKVAVLHNEKPVVVDGCNAVMCPVQDFFKKYKPIAENCNLDRICCTS